MLSRARSPRGSGSAPLPRARCRSPPADRPATHPSPDLTFKNGRQRPNSEPPPLQQGRPGGLHMRAGQRHLCHRAWWGGGTSLSAPHCMPCWGNGPRARSGRRPAQALEAGWLQAREGPLGSFQSGLPRRRRRVRREELGREHAAGEDRRVGSGGAAAAQALLPCRELAWPPGTSAHTARPGPPGPALPASRAEAAAAGGPSAKQQQQRWLQAAV